MGMKYNTVLEKRKPGMKKKFIPGILFVTGLTFYKNDDTFIDMYFIINSERRDNGHET